MTNLLEQGEGRARHRELWARSVVVVLILCSLLACTALALALSVYATVYVDAQADTNALTRIQTGATQGKMRERRTEIANLRERVKTILATAQEGTRTAELAFIAGEVSPGISVRGIQIERASGQPSRITLALSAKERSQFLTFIDLLRVRTQVTRVEYPTSALVKSTDIATSISFLYTQATSTETAVQKTP